MDLTAAKEWRDNGNALTVVDWLIAEVERLSKPWPIRGVRVEGDKVIVTVKGGNDAARKLCGEIITTKFKPV